MVDSTLRSVCVLFQPLVQSAECKVSRKRRKKVEGGEGEEESRVEGEEVEGREGEEESRVEGREGEEESRVEGGEGEEESRVEGGEGEEESRVEESRVEGGRTEEQSGENADGSETKLLSSESDREVELPSPKCKVPLQQAVKLTLHFVKPFSAAIHQSYVESSGGGWTWSGRQASCIAL